MFRVTIPPRDGVRFDAKIAETAPGRPVLGIDGKTKVGEIMAAYVSKDGYLTLDLTCDVDCTGLVLDRNLAVSELRTWHHPWMR